MVCSEGKFAVLRVVNWTLYEGTCPTALLIFFTCLPCKSFIFKRCRSKCQGPYPKCVQAHCWLIYFKRTLRCRSKTKDYAVGSCNTFGTPLPIFPLISVTNSLISIRCAVGQIVKWNEAGVYKRTFRCCTFLAVDVLMSCAENWAIDFGVLVLNIIFDVPGRSVN